MINEKLLKQAIKVLKSVNEKHFQDSSKKKPLLDDEKDVTVYLQFSLKKIPKCKSIQMIKVNLPHSLLKDSSEVCLITGDLDKKNHKAEIEPDVLHYKELLKKHDINSVSEVLTLRQLRTEYKPYEAKQKLLAAYDVFLADNKIVECLPRVLGRHFFKKRKLPIRVTINTPNLKQQFEKALSTKVFYLTGRGNSCNSEVAHLDMNDADISENVITMTKAFCDKLPGSWENVMGIYLKTALSKAIPVYMSYDNPSEVHLDEPKNDNSYDMDELSTLPDGLVKVYKDGNVRTVRKKRTDETETEMYETADDNKGTENRREKKKHTNDDIVDCLDSDLNEEAVKVSRKSKSKKKEESSMERKTDKDETADDNKVTENRRKKKKHINDDMVICLDSDLNDETADDNKGIENRREKKKYTNDDIVDCLNSDLNEEAVKVSRKSKSKKKEESSTEQKSDKENSLETDMKSKDERNSLGSVLINEMHDDAPYSEIKGDLIVNKKSKKRKSMKNITIREDETSADNELKEDLPKVIGKSKRKREESMLSDANKSLTYSPVQVVKKKKTEENLKGLHSVKRNNKGKQKKKYLL